MIGAGFPIYRPRRLRQNPALRALAAETHLSVSQLVAPLFIKEGLKQKEQIPSMPGQYRFGIAQAAQEAKQLQELGIPAVLLFGIPKKKNLDASGAYSANGVIPQAVQAIKKASPGLAVITDVCLCEYMEHGHCGVIRGQSVDNDATLPLLAQTAVSHAQAGADMVAPSAMMDGQVAAIRSGLDEASLTQVPIMSYSAKFASALYGPFREAAESSPKFSDRRGYQMAPTNAEEALREVALDIQEGADIVMVKPAITSLDLIARIKRKFHWPTAAYQVSGEYALIKAAAAKNWIDEKRLVLELATAVARAGADIIITYHAKTIALSLQR